MTPIRLKKRCKYAGDVHRLLIEKVGLEPKTAAQLLSSIPDAGGEVVRCRDCKYYERGECYHPKYDHINQSLNFDENDFCSYGEQKEAAKHDQPHLR